MTKPQPEIAKLDAPLQHALHHWPSEAGQSVSDLGKEAVESSLAEDAEDVATLRKRASEPEFSLEEVVEDLKRRGLM